MKYVMKGLLKSKMSILCFIFLLTLNLFMMWKLETKEKNYNSYEAIVQQWKTKTYQQHTYLKKAESQEALMKIRNIEDSSFEEYMKMFRYHTSLYDQAYEDMLQTSDVSLCKRYMQEVEIKSQLSAMNLYANVEQGRLFFQNVFEEELNKYKGVIQLEEWPYDTYLIHEYGNQFEHPKEQYLNAKSNVEYQFKMLEQGVEGLTYTQASPWSFLAYQLSMDHIPALLTAILAILYTMSWVIMLKDSGSIRLICCRPSSLIRVIMGQLCCVCISYLLIVFLAYFIPVVYLGVRYSFQDYNVPLLFYQKGLTTFQVPFQIDELRSTIGLSTYASAMSVVEPEPYVIAEELSFVRMPVVLFFSVILSVLKLIVYCWTMLCISFWIRNKWFIIGLGAVLISILAVSQTMDILSVVNPFSLSPSLLITEGAGIITWLHAVVLLIFTGSINMLYQFVMSKRKEIE